MKKISRFLILVFIFQIVYSPILEVQAQIISKTTNESDELKDKFKCFRYGIFTGDTVSNFEFAGDKFYLDGSMRSNNKAIANCNDFSVTRNLETVNGDEISANKVEIGQKLNVKNIIQMPDLFSELVDEIKDKADIYYNTSVFGDESVSLEKSAIIKGDAVFNYSKLNSKGSLLVENNIMMNFDDYTMEDSDKAFMYSAKGNIIINARNSTVNGVLYAPNGSVVFNGDKINLNGRIIAKRVIINAREVNIKTSDDDLSLINQKPIVDAGEDTSVEIPNELSLQGIVQDEGLINETLDINWSKVSGPGEVKFKDSKLPITNCEFSEPGEYVLELSAYDGEYTSKDTVKVTVTGKSIGDIDLSIKGNLKENRKVIFDFSNTKSNEKYPLQIDKTEFKIEPITEGISQEDIKEDMENFNPLTRNCLFKKPGEYKVKIKLYNEKDSSEVEKVIKIEPDEVPIANFQLENKTYYRDSSTGRATISLKDMSYSNDNDKVSKRVWKVRYDSNNDGSFEDEEFEVIEASNDLEPQFSTNRVGKYKVYLEVVESFGDTIEKFIKDEDYKRADTKLKIESETMFEVGNEKPSSRVEVEKAKNADIVVTVGKADSAKINLVGSRIEELKKKLEERGINAKVSTISTSSITAQDSFAWTTYEHPGHVQPYRRPDPDKHVVIQDKNIRMIGYTVDPLKDFLYVADNNKTQKTFTFDINSENNNWHTIEGGGFLFNTTIVDGPGIPEDKQTIEGYCILLTSSGLKLDRINKTNLNNFRDGKNSNYVEGYGKCLKSFSFPNPQGNHKLKIVVDSNSISLWDGEKLIIDNYELPDKNVGSGFGPITSHVSHYCDQESYFTFKNIVMETVTGQNLQEALNNYQWTPGAERFLLNLSDEKVEDLKDVQNISNVAATILSKNLNFIALGNDNNRAQYTSLIKAYCNNGMYLENNDIDISMENLQNYVLTKVLSKDYKIDQYVAKGEEVNYAGYYTDPEKDPIFKSQWRYFHDPSVYENNEGLIEDNDKDIDKPIKIFNKTGAYGIKLKVRDNPVGDNNNLDSYRQWSDESITQKVIMVNRRPIVDLDVKVTNRLEDTKNCYITMTDSAYDLDHESQPNKGIVSKEYYWKNINDEKWTEGKIPNILPAEQDYLVMVKAKDIEGFYSEPKVKYITTRNVVKQPQVVDTEKPKVTLKLSKYTANVGERINVETSATDNVGVETVQIYIDNKLATNYLGITSFIANEGKVIPVKVVVADAAGNETVVEAECKVTDNRDKVAPTVEISAPANNSTIYGPTQIVGTVKDNMLLKSYKLMYRLRGTEEYTTITESSDAKENEVLGTFDTRKLATGLYEIKLFAEDKTGNTSWVEETVRFNNPLPPEEVDNEAPVISLDLSKTQATVGEKVQGKLAVTDNKGVESIVLKINGKVVITGEGGFEFTEGEPRIDTIEVTATDTIGNVSILTKQCQFIDERDKVAPTVNIISPVHGSKIDKKVDIVGTVKDETKLEKYILQIRKQGDNDFKTIIEGSESKENEVIGTIDPEKYKDGLYEVKLTAIDAGGNSRYIQYVYEISTGTDPVKPDPNDPTSSDKEKPSLSLSVSKSVANVGENVDVYVTAKDNVKVNSLKVYVDGKEISIKNGIGSFSSDVAKIIPIEAVATDASGNESRVKLECRVVDNSDKTMPIADIKTPEPDSVITAPTKIIGTAKDETKLEKYTLEYRLQGTTEYKTIKEGNSEVADGELGVFDPTMLQNGIYDVKLTVVDQGGNSTSITTTYSVEGAMKIGQVAMQFLDLKSNFSGIDMSLTRKYDNTNKVKGDFGVGWTQGFNNIKITQNEVIGKGWEQIQAGSLLSTQYRFVETTKHNITVDYGNGKSDKFNVVLSPQAQMYVPLFETSVKFVCTTNKDVKLDIEGDNSVMFLGGLGEGDLYDSALNLDSPFNPKRFKLTTKNGTEVILNKDTGVESIKDNKGNSVKIDKDGVINAAGKGIRFLRDNEGRIISATDFSDNEVKYSYDKYGNLETVINPVGDKVTFKYDNNHNITEIIDPSGAAVARNEYDSQGRLKCVVDANGNRTEYSHDISGRQEIITDNKGNKTTMLYDEKGNVLTKVNALGQTTTFTYDERGNKLTETDGLGATTSFEYDGDKVTKVIDALGNKTEYTYNSYGLMETEVDKLGNKSTRKYDDLGCLKSESDKDGNIVSYTNDSNGKLTEIKDPLGNSISYTYNKDGMLESEKDYNGNETRYRYDTNGNIVSKINKIKNGDSINEQEIKYSYDALNRKICTVYSNGTSEKVTYNALGKISTKQMVNGEKISYEYDGAGNCIKVKYEDGTEESSIYDGDKVISKTSRDGNVTRYQYDAMGRLTKTISTTGITKESIYDANGNVIKEIDGNGNYTEYSYDKGGRTVDVKNSLGVVAKYGYDANGNKTSEIDANGNVTKYEYDKNSQLVKKIFADNTSIEYGYNVLGNKIWEKNQKGYITKYEYNSFGQVTLVTDAKGNKTEYGYDSGGKTVYQKDAKGNVTNYIYDSLGRKAKTILPLGMNESYEYDDLGRMTTKTSFNQEKIKYEYNNEGKVTNIIYPDGNKDEFIYNISGRVKEAKNKDGKVSYEYDNEGNLIKETKANGDELKYTYDKMGNRLTMETNGGTVSYNYDSCNRLTYVKGIDGNVTNYNYDNVGNIKSMSYPNGNTTKYEYDKLNRLTSLENLGAKSNLLSSYNYELSSLGDITKIVESSGKEMSYEYDELERVTKEQISEGNRSLLSNEYQYDNVGNRIKKTENEKETSYTYDNNNRLINENNKTYEYDNNGNLILSKGDEETRYSYDYNNKLTKIEGKNTINYTYDINGNRISKNENGKISRYLVDSNRENPQVIEERGEDGKTIASYTVGYNVISQNRNGNESYYLYDGQGNVRNLTNKSSDITDSYSYDAFGNIIDKKGTTENEFMYTGEQYDAGSGLYYLRARYMNPKQGRFTSMDTWEGEVNNPNSLNKYDYVYNNPVNYTDPSGNIPFFFKSNPALGRAVEKLVQVQYDNTHLGDRVYYGKWFGKWTGEEKGSEGYRLKPDILNISRLQFMEIKPLSIAGAIQAQVQMGIYMATFVPKGYLPDIEWCPKNDNYLGKGVYFLNFLGVIFYTYSEEERELAINAPDFATLKSKAKNQLQTMDGIPIAGILIGSVGMAAIAKIVATVMAYNSYDMKVSFSFALI